MSHHLGEASRPATDIFAAVSNETESDSTADTYDTPGFYPGYVVFSRRGLRLTIAAIYAVIALFAVVVMATTDTSNTPARELCDYSLPGSDTSVSGPCPRHVTEPM